MYVDEENSFVEESLNNELLREAEGMCKAAAAALQCCVCTTGGVRGGAARVLLLCALTAGWLY